MEFKGRQVRMIVKNNEPWWVAADVCTVLSLSNTTMALQSLAEDEKAKFNLGLTGGATNVVNEFGLYNLVLGSRKPEAKDFKRWVTHEVLPALRKEGCYAITTDTPKNRYAMMRQMLDAMEEHDTRISTLEYRVDLFGADTGYRTIRAYCNETGRKLSERAAKDKGIDAGRLCRQKGIDVGKVADERHGKVNSYPVEVLDEVFSG